MTSGGWAKGYTKTEFDDAQEKFGLVFPPDLVVLLRDRWPLDGHASTDEVAIRRMLVSYSATPGGEPDRATACTACFKSYAAVADDRAVAMSWKIVEWRGTTDEDGHGCFAVVL